MASKTESIVFTHFGFFSPGTDSLQQYTDKKEVYYLMHLFETHGVNYVFMGHTHFYDYHQVNGVNYLNLADFSDDGKPKDFIRVHVNGSAISCERIPL